MKKIKFIALLVAFLTVNSSFSQVLFTEDFSSAAGFSTSTPFFSDGFGDYFGIAGLATNDFGGGSDPSSLKPYTGFTGGFLTGMDLNGEGATVPVSITWAGIDISGASSLQFSGDFAEYFDDPGDIDELDVFFVEAQIDAGGYTTILEFIPANFTSTSGPFNGFYTANGLTLGNAAQTFTASISGTGALLDLRVVVGVEAGDEDFAIDNLTITNVPEPSTIAAILGLFALGFVMYRRRK